MVMIIIIPIIITIIILMIIYFYYYSSYYYFLIIVIIYIYKSVCIYSNHRNNWSEHPTLACTSSNPVSGSLNIVLHILLSFPLPKQCPQKRRYGFDWFCLKIRCLNMSQYLMV